MWLVDIILIVIYSLVALLTWCGVVYSIWNLCHFNKFDKSPKIVTTPKKESKKIKKELESQDNVFNIMSSDERCSTCKCELRDKINELTGLVNNYYKEIKLDEMEIRRLNHLIAARQDSENKWFVQSIEAQTTIDMLQEEVQSLNTKLLEYEEKVNDN